MGSDFSLYDLMPPKYKEMLERRRKEAEAALEENCTLLGIDASEVDDPIVIAERAKKKRTCIQCQYTIDNCFNCEYAFGWRCEKYKQYEKRCAVYQILQDSKLGQRFMNKQFYNFNVTPGTKDTYNTCWNFCESFSRDSRGLRLIGPYGSGKTHLAAAIIHKLAENGVKSYFAVVPELLDIMRRDYDDNNAMWRNVEYASLLVLDDLGAERPTEWTREQLYRLINSRYETLLPTVITTNYSTKDLVERIGQRIVSRLVEMTTPCKLDAEDYRLRL